MTEGDTQITYVGHATLIIEMDGIRLLTDPILRNRLLFLRRHLPLQRSDERLQNFDAVLISHIHYDHLDLPSLRSLGLDQRLIVPAGAAKWLRKHGFRHVEELGVGETTDVASLSITATPAIHPTTRHRFGPQIDSCLGYLIHGSDKIYFAGDTDLFDEMASLCNALDLALLPVWGWGPSLGIGHLDPQRAAQSLQLLQPRYAIPIHWGTLHPIDWHKSSPAFLHRPPQDFADFASQLAPDVQVTIVPPGGSWTLPSQP